MSEVQRLDIESVQREFQGRFEGLFHKLVQWRGCGCDESVAPPYPKDRFYGDELTHLKQLALVRDLRDKFWDMGTRIWPQFVKEELCEGWTDEWVLPAYDDITDFPYISDDELTIDTYPAKFKLIKKYINKLVAVRMDATQTGTTANNPPDFRDGSGDGSSSSTAKSNASSAWQSGQWWAEGNGNWEPNFGNIGIMELGGGASGTPNYYSVWGRSVRGRIVADATYYSKGTADCYVFMRRGENGSADGPPTTANNAWHKLSGATLGTLWYSSVYGNQAPSFTVSTPLDDSASIGWMIETQALVAKPQWRTKADKIECNGCKQHTCRQGGSSGSLGSSSGTASAAGAGSTGSLQYTVGLGHVSDGGFAGWISLNESYARPEMATPQALRASADPEVTVIEDGSGVLRQVLTPQGLSDVVPDGTNAYKYYLRFYKKSQVGALSGGLYTIVSGQQNNWYKQVTVENPDFVVGQPLTTWNRLKITESDGPSPGTVREVKLYAYTASPEKWEMSSGWDATTSQYLRWESKSFSVSGSQRTETLEVRNNSSTGAVVYKETDMFQTFAWGEERVSHQVDPAGANLTTTWTYYTDPLDTNNYGCLKQLDEPSGYWERYSYDSSGRLIKTVSQYQNQPNTASDSNSVVVERTYESVDILGSDGRPGTDTYADLRETLVEKVGGVEVARRYRVVSGNPSGYDYTWEIECPTTSAAWNDTANLVTIRKSNKFDGSASEGKPVTVIRANGNATAFYATTNYSDSTESDPNLGANGIKLSATPRHHWT